MVVVATSVAAVVTVISVTVVAVIVAVDAAVVVVADDGAACDDGSCVSRCATSVIECVKRGVRFC